MSKISVCLLWLIILFNLIILNANARPCVKKNAALAYYRYADSTINVKSFGAKGNGITDDTHFIEAALQAAGNKLKLFFPEGIYLINRELKISTGILGAGEGKTVIKLHDASTINLEDRMLRIADDNVLLNGFTLDGNSANNLGTPLKGVGGIVGGNIRRLVIKNVTIKDTRSMAIQLENFPNSTLAFITVYNCGRYGKEVEKGYQTDRLGILIENRLLPGNTYYCGEDVKINNIKITGAGMDGLSSSVGTYYYKIITDHCGAEMATHDPGAAGIYFRSTDYIEGATFDHCEANYNTGIGIDVGNLPGLSKPVFKNVKILNCTASYNYLNGIAIAGLQKGLIKSCIAYNNGQLKNLFTGAINVRRAGIAINGSEKVLTSDISILNNTCYDDQISKTQTYGLFIGTHFLKRGGTSANYNVRNNNFLNNKYNGIERDRNESNMDVVTKGFLSIQKNKGISALIDTVVNNAEISPIGANINLIAYTNINLKNIKQGLPGDKIILRNISKYRISFKRSDKLITGRLKTYTLNTGQSATFECVLADKWKLISHK